MNSFNPQWDDIYASGRGYAKYPYDLLVTLFNRLYGHIPRKARIEMNILDLGCGVGNNMSFLINEGFDVFGFDGSEQAIQNARARLGLCIGKRLLIGDFLRLPYPREFFHCAVDRSSIYANTTENIVKIIKQVRRVLRTGGIFISFMYSVNDPDASGSFTEDSKFYKTSTAHFTTQAEIHGLFAGFEIMHISQHSCWEVEHTASVSLMPKYDEFIIIARKG
jgi:SAM-dependent methyltransferase